MSKEKKNADQKKSSHSKDCPPLTKQVINQVIRMKSCKTDPQGSYTGKPVNPYEVPVQDADDL